MSLSLSSCAQLGWEISCCDSSKSASVGCPGWGCTRDQRTGGLVGVFPKDTDSCHCMISCSITSAGWSFPTCSPWKAFETWGSAPDPAGAGGGPFFFSFLVLCPGKRRTRANEERRQEAKKRKKGGGTEAKRRRGEEKREEGIRRRRGEAEEGGEGEEKKVSRRCRTTPEKRKEGEEGEEKKRKVAERQLSGKRRYRESNSGFFSPPARTCLRRRLRRAVAHSTCYWYTLVHVTC
jgi:hypothetical protein